jgi:hypothetical protein
MKVTVLIVIIFIITLTSCKHFNSLEEELAFQQRLDSINSKVIDSAYNSITGLCDSAFKYQIPLITDSLVNLAKESNLMYENQK